MTRASIATLLLAGAVHGCTISPTGASSVKLPDDAPGIGFDDLRYSSTLRRVLVPAGRSGRLDLCNVHNTT